MSDISDIVLRIRVDIVNSAAITSLVQSMQRVDAQSKKTGQTAGILARAATKVGQAFAKITDPLSKVERKLDAVFRAGVHMQAVGRDLLGFASKLAGAAKGMTDEWGKFEFTLNRAAAAADIFDNTSPIFKELKKAVYDAAHELRVFPAEEVARGLYFWQSTTGEVIKTQEDLRQTMTNVTTVMKLAAMTDTGYETAIKGVYSTLKQFNLTTKDTAKVSALLFYATQKTALEFPDLINAFKMTGAVMGQAKEPLTTMVAVLGAIGNAGFRGSQAGRALRQTYIKIVKPTKAAKEELDKLFKAQGGYNKVAFDSKGNFIGMEKYVMKLAKATKGMTYQQKAHLLATITTANELPVLTQMLRMAEGAVKSGSKSWVDFSVSQEKATEAFNKSWDILSVSWRGVVGSLKQAVQPTLLEVGRIIAEVLTPVFLQLSDAIYAAGPVLQDIAQQIADTFRPVVEFVGEFIKKFITWATANKKLVATFAKWGIIAAVVGGVVGAILLFLGTLVLLASSLATVLLGAMPLIGVFIAMGVVIAALAYGFYKNIGGIKEAFARFGAALWRVLKLFIGGSDDATDSVDNMRESFKKFASGLTGKLADILNAIASALEKLTPEQVEIIKKIVGALLLMKAVNTVLGISMGIMNGFTGNIISMAGAMKNAYPHIVTFLGAFKPSNLKAIGTTLLTVGAQIVGFGRAIGVALYAALGPVGLVIGAIVLAITAFVVAYETNFLGFKDFVDGIVAWFIANVVPVIQQAIEFFGPIIEQVVSAVGGFITTLIGIIGGIIDFFANLPANIQKFIDEVITNIQNFVNNFITMVTTFLTDLATNWSYYLGYILGVIIAFPIKVLIEIVKFGVNLITAIVDFLSKLPGRFADWFGKVWNTLSTWFGNTITDVARWAGQMIGKIVDFFVALPGRILGFLGTLWTTISNWFIETIPKVAKAAGDMIKAIVDFFIALPGNVVEALKNFPKTIADAFNGFVKAGSQIIKAVIDVGEAIVRGIWKGISGMVEWFTKQVTNFFSGIVDGVKDTLGISSPSKVFAEIGTNMVLGLAKGIESTQSAKTAMDNVIGDLSSTAANATVGLQAGGNFNARTTSENTRRVELAVEVNSPDGSVGSMDMTTLAGLITGSDMVRALERMSTVD